MAKPRIKIDNWFVATFGETTGSLTFHDPYLFRDFSAGYRNVYIVGDLVEGKLIASTDGTAEIMGCILAASKRRVAVFDAGRIELWHLGAVNKKYRRWLTKELGCGSWDYRDPVVTYHDEIFEYFERHEKKHEARYICNGINVGNDPCFW